MTPYEVEKKKRGTHRLGVKLIGKSIDLEPADMFGNITKYEMILTDKLTDSWNGNYSYRCDITMVDNSLKYYIVNGWKLLYFDFPGNWYGQQGTFIAKDRYGSEIKYKTCSQGCYWRDYESMLKVCLGTFITFANNHSYAEEVKSQNYNMTPFKRACTLDNLSSLLKRLDGYIEAYNSIKNKINEDVSLNEQEKEIFLDKIKNTVKSEIDKYIGSDIIVL